MACKYHCGKLYSKADVSNLVRHEKTCRRNRDQRQLVDGHVLTDRGSLHANISGPVHDLEQSSGGDTSYDSAFQDQLALFENLHGRIESVQKSSGWRNDRYIVEAIETLQRVLAGGPASGALKVFTRSLDNLGPFVQTSKLASSAVSNEKDDEALIRLSDDHGSLAEVRQNGYESCVTQDPWETDWSGRDHAVTRLPVTPKRKIDNDNADFPHVSPKRNRPVDLHDPISMITTQEEGDQGEKDEYKDKDAATEEDEDDEEEGWDENEDEDEDEDEDYDDYVSRRTLEIHGHIVRAAAEVCSAHDEVLSITLTMTKSMYLIWLDRFPFPEQPNSSSVVTDLRSQISDVLSSYKLRNLHPNIITFAFVFLWWLLQKTHKLALDVDSHYREIHIALMLAETYSEAKYTLREVWIKITGLSMHEMAVLGHELFLSIDDTCTELRGFPMRHLELLNRVKSYFGCHNDLHSFALNIVKTEI